MNIFALSECPRESAQEMLDKHVVKMPTESCQMLHTNILYMRFISECRYEPSLAELKIYHKMINSRLMKPAMLNHPSTIWARKSLDNFNWLLAHGKALCEEFTFRYGKRHGSYDRILDVVDYGKLLRSHDFTYKELTPVTIAMDDYYRLDRDVFCEDQYDEWDFVIESYRNYYLEGKWKFATWRKGRTPSWWPVNHYKKMRNAEIKKSNEIFGTNTEMIE
jgi:hypothetical protein